MFDPEKFGEAMGAAIREAVGPLEKRIDELQSQIKAAPNFEAMVQEEVRKRLADIPEPKHGKDADMEVVRQMVSEAVAALPAPKDGKAGDPGKSLTLDDVRPVLDEAIVQLRKDADAAIAEPVQLVERACDKVLEQLSTLKQPEDGKSVTVDDVAPLIRSEIEKAVSALPAPKDGLGLAGAMIDRDGALQITFTNGEVKSLGVVVGKDGEDGSDGISLDAFEMEYLPESHEIAIKAAVGTRVKELRYPAGGIRPGGYWREGTKAQSNEAWVHDGSLWIAKTATASKPESRSEDWIIAARKGRDGETVVKTINAAPPAPIKLQG
jgi:hypothetical protein